MRNPIDQMFTTYINLGSPRESPLHAWGPEFTYRRLAAGISRGPVLQRVLPDGFRQELALLAIGDHVAVKDPREVPKEARANRWNQPFELFDHYGKLAIRGRANVHWLLISLSFSSLVGDLASTESVHLDVRNETDCRYLFSVATARYIQHFEVDGSYEVKEFEFLATGAPKGSSVRFNSRLHMVVQNARHIGNAKAVRHWADECESEVHDVISQARDFDKHLLFSRMYRGTSFAPFLEGGKQETVDVMEQAEWHAQRALECCESLDDEIVCKENWIPLLQSRSKEAIWLGDLALAESRLQRAANVDPLDAMRWCELGDVRIKRGAISAALEAFLKAAALCPPGSAYCWLMIGSCYEGAET